MLRNGYSLSGAQVGDEVEIEYRQTSGGEYELTDNVEVDDDSDDGNGSNDD